MSTVSTETKPPTSKSEPAPVKTAKPKRPGPTKTTKPKRPAPTKTTSDSDQAGRGAFRLEVIINCAEAKKSEFGEYRELVSRLAGGKAGPDDTPKRILELLALTGVSLSKFYAHIKHGPASIATCLDPELVNCLKEESADLDHQRSKVCQRFTELRGEPAYSQEQLERFISDDPVENDKCRVGNPRGMHAQNAESLERHLRSDIKKFTREKPALLAKNASIMRELESIQKVVASLYVRL